jgi:hypothetical protein
LKAHTHTRLEDERVAATGLPDLSAPLTEVRKTGTENLGSEDELQGALCPGAIPSRLSAAAPSKAPPSLMESTESAPETGSEADESWRWRRDSNPRVTDLQSARSKTERPEQQALAQAESEGLASSLARIGKADPNLAKLIVHWRQLPQRQREAIMILLQG